MKNMVYLVLGSNVDRERCYPAAVRIIASFCEVNTVSVVYETVPVGMESPVDFFNGAMSLSTELPAEGLKRRLVMEVEEALGRIRNPGKGWRPRTIDVDIALWNDEIREILGRPVPDPDIVKYLHVARPLADIAPQLVVPGTGRTLAEIAADLETRQALLHRREDIILEW